MFYYLNEKCWNYENLKCHYLIFFEEAFVDFVFLSIFHYNYDIYFIFSLYQTFSSIFFFFEKADYYFEEGISNKNICIKLQINYAFSADVFNI